MADRAVRIILVEADPERRFLLAQALEWAGYAVLVLADDRRLASEMAGERVDAVVALSPESLGRPRFGPSDPPVVIPEPVPPDRADGLPVLDAVAADAIARVSALVARSAPVGQVLAVADLVVDQASRVAMRGEHPMELTRRQFDLLVVLVRHVDRVLPKASLPGMAWASEPLTLNAVEAHISGLRREMERYGPRLIETVRGVGYVLRSSPERSAFDIRRRGFETRRQELARSREQAVARREELTRQRRSGAD
jgi:two-component system, OmpR family, response regulator